MARRAKTAAIRNRNGRSLQALDAAQLRARARQRVLPALGTCGSPTCAGSTSRTSPTGCSARAARPPRSRTRSTRCGRSSGARSGASRWPSTRPSDLELPTPTGRPRPDRLADGGARAARRAARRGSRAVGDRVLRRPAPRRAPRAPLVDVDLAAARAAVAPLLGRREGPIEAKTAQGAGPCRSSAPSRPARRHKLRTGRAARRWCLARRRAAVRAVHGAKPRADGVEGGALTPIGLHECRHTFASLMIAAGVNAKAICDADGPRHVTMTFDRYGHLMPEVATRPASGSTPSWGTRPRALPKVGALTDSSRRSDAGPLRRSEQPRALRARGVRARPLRRRLGFVRRPGSPGRCRLQPPRRVPIRISRRTSQTAHRRTEPCAKRSGAG